MDALELGRELWRTRHQWRSLDVFLSRGAMLPWILLGWLVLINGVSFGAVGLDKRIAKRRERQAPQHQSRRIPERTLFGLGMLGGIWGLIIGMRRFRHKTRKTGFIIATVVILLINLGYYYLIAVFGFGW